VQALLRGRTGGDAVEPGGHVGEPRVERLADPAPEVEGAVENDVGDGEAVAGDPALAGISRSTSRTG
jgi:hypothetical protein